MIFSYGKDETIDKSFVNKDDVEFIINLILSLKYYYPDVQIQNRIGIITPYKAQVNLV